MSFASNLQFHRMKSGMNQNQLAEAVGITASQISRYENGLAHPRIAVAHKIAEALGVPFELLTAHIALAEKPRNKRGEGRTKLEIKVTDGSSSSTFTSLENEKVLTAAIQNFLSGYIAEIYDEEPDLLEALREYRLTELRLSFVGQEKEEEEDA